MAEFPDFGNMGVGELRALADTLDVKGSSKMKKSELIDALMEIAQGPEKKPSTATETRGRKRKVTEVEEAVESSEQATETNTESTQTTQEAPIEGRRLRERRKRPSAEESEENSESGAPTTIEFSNTSTLCPNFAVVLLCGL